MRACKVVALISTILITTSAYADPGSYAKSCEKEDGYLLPGQVRCLNAHGFELIKLTTNSTDTSSTGPVEKLFIKGQLFKLYDLNGRDITPSKKLQDKYFAGSMPNYAFVNGQIHAFYGTSEDSESLCISATTGKKVTCP